MIQSTRDAALALLDGGPHEHACVVRTLLKFGHGSLHFARRHAIRVVPLRRHEPYSARSPALRRLAIDVDAWPAPPAGLFVVEERTVYLRSRSAMTVAHEFGHACVINSSTTSHIEIASLLGRACATHDSRITDSHPSASFLP